MNITKALLIAIASLGAAAGAVLPAAAADNKDVFATATSDEWKFEITPYLWAPGVKGTFTVAGHPLSIDQDFSNIFKVVKFAGDALGVAHYRQWLVWTQIDYFYMNTDKLNNPPTHANLNSKMLFATVAGGYQFNLWREGQTLDVLVGEQFAGMRNTITLYNINSWEDTRDVVDTVLILRPSVRLSQRWRFNPTMSFGGGDSENTYQLQPQFQYQFSDRMEARIGYRKLHYTIKSDRNNELDFNLAGPFIGFGWTF